MSYILALIVLVVGVVLATLMSDNDGDFYMFIAAAFMLSVIVAMMPLAGW